MVSQPPKKQEHKKPCGITGFMKRMKKLEKLNKNQVSN